MGTKRQTKKAIDAATATPSPVAPVPLVVPPPVATLTPAPQATVTVPQTPSPPSDPGVVPVKRATRRKTVVDKAPAPQPSFETAVPIEVVVEATPIEPDSSESSTTAETGRRRRRGVSKEQIATSMETLFGELTDSVTSKDLLKKIKQFRTDLTRALKLKNTTGEKKERDTSNSGFMKPIKVSEPMRQFLGLEQDQLTRRLDITKKLCEYIKTNDLQNPSDRRNILPDTTLKELLNIHNPDEQLTYYSIQQKLKDHVIKV